MSDYPNEADGVTKIINDLPDQIGSDEGGPMLADGRVEWSLTLEFPERLRATAESALDKVDAIRRAQPSNGGPEYLGRTCASTAPS